MKALVSIDGSPFELGSITQLSDGRLMSWEAHIDSAVGMDLAGERVRLIAITDGLMWFGWVIVHSAVQDADQGSRTDLHGDGPLIWRTYEQVHHSASHSIG